jgi:peptidyl-prolyl cis-trans isomerase SurA
MRRVLFVGIIITVAPHAWAQKAGADPVLFSVDAARTHSSEFEYLYRKNHQNKPDEFTKDKIKEYLELFINFKLKVTEARSRGLDTTRAFINELESYKSELRKPYVASTDQVDKLVKEAYQRMTEEVRASHLLVAVGPDATPADTLAAWNKTLALRQQISAGESFEKVAAQYSDDPSAKENGGDLGYFTVLQMVYPFESAAYNLNEGEMSGPVRTQFGYHLILLKDKRPASGDVEVSHILMRGKDEKVRDKAFDAFDQLKAGRKWEDVCKEYSEDAGTRENGGHLQRFSMGTIPLPEFETMAYSLTTPGEFSDPFPSSMGWHIIRLENKFPVQTFKEVEPALKRTISRNERLQIGQEAELTRRKKQFNVVEESATLDLIMNLADTSLQKGRWHVLKEGPHSDKLLFTSDGKSVNVSRFYSFISQRQRPSALPPAAYLRQLYHMFMDAEISAMEDEKLQRENADYRNLLREYHEGILLFSVMEKEVWNKASSDTLGQKRYYEAHKSKYTAGERVHARVFGTPDSAQMTLLRERVERKDTLKPADLRKLKVVTGFRAFERGDHKAVDQISWSAGLHESHIEGVYYLVEVDRLIPAGIKTFAEARASVISDYQDELEKTWVTALKKKYKVKVNKPAAKAVTAKLESK